MFKKSGYLVSTLSVILLAIVSLKGAKDDPFMMVLLVLGALASIAGMGMRWISFDRDEKANPQSALDREGRATRVKPAPFPEHRAPEEFARQASRH
jgi:hypothetical protein